MDSGRHWDAPKPAQVTARSPAAFGSSGKAVTAACVFCSVGDPVRGLREAARVVGGDGQVLLYEHVRPRNRLLGRLTDLVSPLTRRLFGPEFNRDTERNVETAGLRIVEVRRRGILREIVAALPNS